jgi:hypothetical protein
MTRKHSRQTRGTAGTTGGVRELRAAIRQTPYLVDPEEEWAESLAADVFAAQRALLQSGQVDAGDLQKTIEVLVILREGVERWALAYDTLRQLLVRVLKNEEVLRVEDEAGRFEVTVGPTGWIAEGKPVTLFQPMPEPPDSLSAILDAIDPALAEVRERFEAWLVANADAEYDTLTERKRVASMIQEVTSRLRLAVVCPDPDCGRPAILRCNKAKRSKTGVFQFEHVIEGRRTAHGGFAKLPRLTLIPKPEDRRKSVLSEEPVSE